MQYIVLYRLNHQRYAVTKMNNNESDKNQVEKALNEKTCFKTHLVKTDDAVTFFSITGFASHNTRSFFYQTCCLL